MNTISLSELMLSNELVDTLSLVENLTEMQLPNLTYKYLVADF